MRMFNLTLVNKNTKSEHPKNFHWVNYTYYANIFHLKCNGNRQGPSGSDDRCQPLIINVSSERSVVPGVWPHSGLDFPSRHRPTFIFSLVVCNHCGKPCCHRLIFQNDFWLMIPVINVLKKTVTWRSQWKELEESRRVFNQRQLNYSNRNCFRKLVLEAYIIRMWCTNFSCHVLDFLITKLCL